MQCLPFHTYFITERIRLYNLIRLPNFDSKRYNYDLSYQLQLIFHHPGHSVPVIIYL